MCKPIFDSSKIVKKNAILEVRPELFDEWDFVKNNELDLDIYEMTRGSEKVAWWKCELGHEWEAMIKDRVKTNCSVCSNKKILIGYNDLWTTHPHVTEFLLDPDDGYKYTHGSGEKVCFKCIFCNKTIGKKIIKNVVSKGLKCPDCQYTRSLSERIMTALLNQVNLKFKNEKRFIWSDNRKYDFYIPSLNIIIETHGEQHYKNSFNNGRTLEDEQENDRYKSKIAFINNIKHYIIIDCEKSEFNYIKDNIINSDLNNFINFDNVDWIKIFKETMIPIAEKVCSIYSRNQEITLKEIAEICNISTYSVMRYLASASENGLSDYTPNSKRNKSNSVKQFNKPIVQLSLDGKFIKEFESITKALESVNGSSASFLSACCRGEYKTAYNFRWMYLSDYKNYTENKKAIPKLVKSKRVVQLSLSGEYIREWESSAEVCRELKIKGASSLRACLVGKNHTSNGYRWMYLSDYENYIKGKQNKQIS